MPIYVDVVPEPEATINDCFPLVAARVEENGGKSILGWSIWEWPTLFVEAEFHSVWENPAHSLIDIAPKSVSIARVLFLPDPASRYEGRQVMNARRPISKHRAVMEFISACEAEYEFLNRGERTYRHGELHFENEEAREFEKIHQKKFQAGLEMVRLKPTIEPYDPCWCSSGKKVKWCHGTKER